MSVPKRQLGQQILGMSMLMLLNNLGPNLPPAFDTASATPLTSCEALLVHSSDAL